MPVVTQSETRSLLQSSADKKVSEFSKDTKLVKALTNVFNASLKIAENFPQTKGQLATAIANKSLSVSGAASVATGSRGLEMTNFAASQTLKSIGLIKVAGMTPAKASMYITLVMAEKVIAAAGLGQVDKCKMAIASLTVSIGAGAFVCDGTLGIGCIAGAIAVAADAFDVYGRCSGN